MLEHYEKFYPFRDHPIKEEIKKQFDLQNSSSSSKRLLQDNIVFLYPRIFSFSFNPYSKSFKRYERPVDDFLVEGIDIPSQEEIVLKQQEISQSGYSDFFDLLVKVFKILKLNPIIIIDLRNAQLLNITVLIHILKILYDKENIINTILFAPDTLVDIIKKDLLDTYYDKLNFIDSIKDLNSYFENFISDEKNILKIELPNQVNVFSFENKLKEMDFGNAITNKFVIELDFKRVYKISFFCLNLLNIFIHTISHKYGVIWTMDYNVMKKKVLGKIVGFRLHDTNRLFLNYNKNSPPVVEQLRTNFGVFMFDENYAEIVYKKFGIFVHSNLLEMFGDYLQEGLTRRQEVKYTSYVDRPLEISYLGFITSIAYELIDNVMLHSKGIGYFSCGVFKYHLFLFIGDCGIGLKEGILRNYDLADTIKTEEDAIKQLFNLSDYNKLKRIGEKDFNVGHVGKGLKKTLNDVFNCNGRFLYRSGSCVGAFLNPVKRANIPSKITTSYIHLSGTQYMIIIPISDQANLKFANTYDDFLKMED